ncbi:helix-turn-helix transcriptional regulator [Pseudoalteromonas sp. T1lg10]|uniref:helix-turn-helix transcriptional regulator n=1 Tax=Pseudoalteromonas sp. T1lg10 TaxID=2077093 RepID=UPI000CF683F4|nr:WYL domain-containing protein [Pseudoalteromonas sp. T1lg10]
MGSKGTSPAERLVIIITRLNDGEALSKKELAEEFNVDLRTIQRDVNEKLAFLPLIHNNSYFRLEPSALGRLSPVDIRNFSELTGVGKLFPNLDTKFVTKLLSQVYDNPFTVKGYHYEATDLVRPNLEKLEAIIRTYKTVHFTYKDKQYRHVKPYRLVNSKGIWYLAAVDKDTLKAFHLLDMKHIFEQEETFEPNEVVLTEIEEEDGIFFNAKKFEVVVKVSKDIAEYFLRRSLFPNQRIIEELETGELLVSSRVATDKQILPLIRYWIPEIEVISPDGIKHDLLEELNNYLSRVAL